MQWVLPSELSWFTTAGEDSDPFSLFLVAFCVKNVNVSGTWVLAANGSVKTCLKLPKFWNNAVRILILVLWLPDMFLAHVSYMELNGIVVEWMLLFSRVSRLWAFSHDIPPLSLCCWKLLPQPARYPQQDLSSALGGAHLFVNLVPGFVCWNNKTQASSWAAGPAMAPGFLSLQVLLY